MTALYLFLERTKNGELPHTTIRAQQADFGQERA